MTKEKAKKGLFIVLGVGVAVLIIWGIIVKAQEPSKGTEQVMQSTSSLDNAVRSEQTAPLTDEQFLYGTDNIIPQCKLSSAEQLTLENSSRSKLMKIAGDQVSCDFLNWFGEPALLVSMPNIDNLELLTSTFSSIEGVKRIIVNLQNDSRVVFREAVYANGEIKETFSMPKAISDIGSPDIQELRISLSEVFGLSEESIVYDGVYLQLNTAGINTTNCLDLFDITFQWLKAHGLAPTLILRNNNLLLANANLKATEDIYNLYNTKSELAPLFRMTYYNTCNFFKNDLQEHCKIYL